MDRHLPRAEHPAREIMKKYGLQVSKMATLLGLSQPSMTRILTGETICPPEIDQQLRAAIFAATGRKLPMQKAPKIVLKRHEEVEGQRLRIEASLVQVSKEFLREPLDQSTEGIEKFMAEVNRITELMDSGRKDEIPDVYILRAGPRNLYLISGRAALLAYARRTHSSSFVAVCYDVRGVDLNYFAGFATETKKEAA